MKFMHYFTIFYIGTAQGTVPRFLGTLCNPSAKPIHLSASDLLNFTFRILVASKHPEY